MIEETQVLLDELPGVTPVHGPFYKVSIYFLFGNPSSTVKKELESTA